MKHVRNLSLASAILFVMPLFYSCNGSGDNEISKIDLIPVKLSQDGNWSMVNKDGEIVYDGEFKNTPTLAYNGYFSVEEGGGYSLYKATAKNPELITSVEGVKAIGFMEDGLIPVVYKNSRIAVIDGNGKKKFTLEPVKGVEITQCNASYNQGLLLIKTDEGKYGYYDKSGKIAIAPNYEHAYNFSDGLAVVGKESKDSTSYRVNYEVINKKGETVYKIKEGYELQTFQFIEGYLIAKNDNRCILLDKKGEITKLPSKIDKIEGVSSKYLIFENAESEYGVADIKGEILIRPKYEHITFNGEENFFVRKRGEDKEILCLNAKGEEQGKALDYDMLIPFGKFGYLAKDGKTWQLLDKEYKQKGKEDFYDISLQTSHSFGISSDYFNPASVAKVMVSMINGNKVGNYKLGGTPAEVLKDSKPASHTYDSSASLPELTKNGFRYNISAKGYFTGTIAFSDYSYYSTSYNWNNDAKLYQVSISMSCESEWGKEGQKELVSALKEAGFKILKEGKYDDNDLEMAIAQKGNIYAIASTQEDSKECTLTVTTDKIENVTEYIINPLLTAIGGTALKVPAQGAVVEVADSVAADTVR